MFLSFSKPKNLDEVIKFIIKICLAAILFTPLIVSFNFYFPYIVPKNLVFRALVEIGFVLHLFLIIRNRDYFPRFNKAYIFFILFVFTLFVSSLFGNGFGFSFWSNFERMDGLVNWIHILMYIFVLLGVFRTREEWRAFINIFLVAAWAVVLYTMGQALEQYTSWEVRWLRSPDPGDRLYATFGNSAYLGSYMFLAIMLAFYMLVYKWKKGWQWFDKNFWWILTYAISIILFVISLSLSQTRASLLGLMMFAFLMGIFYLWFNRKHKNKFYYSILGIFILGIIFIFILFAQKEAAWVQDVKIFKRLTEISLQDGTTETRLLTWRNSLQGVKDKPIIGWGEENFKYVFDTYFPIEIYKHQKSEVWFDRPHNILVQHLIHGGVIALALYLAIFIYLIYALYKNYRKHQSILTRREGWFFNFFWIAFLISFLFHDFFIFDSLNTNVIIYLALAYLFTIGVKNRRKEFKFFNFGAKYDYFALVILLLIWVNLFSFMIYRPWSANRNLLTALDMAYYVETSEDASESISHWEDSLTLSQLGDKEKAEVAGRMLQGFAMNRYLGDQDKNQIVQYFANRTLQEQLNMTNKYPDDIRMKMYLANFYSTSQQLDKAIAVLEEVKNKAPMRPDAYILLSQYYLQLGNLQKSRQAIDGLVAILPIENNNTYVYWNALQVELYYADIDKLRYYFDLIKSANQNKYGYDFSQEEVSTIKQLVAQAEANGADDIANLAKEYIQ